MGKSAPRVLRRKSFVAEVSARIARAKPEAPRLTLTVAELACRKATASRLWALVGTPTLERRACVGWLKAKCLRCGACEDI